MCFKRPENNKEFQIRKDLIFLGQKPYQLASMMPPSEQATYYKFELKCCTIHLKSEKPAEPVPEQRCHNCLGSPLVIMSRLVRAYVSVKLIVINQPALKRTHAEKCITCLSKACTKCKRDFSGRLVFIIYKTYTTVQNMNGQSE